MTEETAELRLRPMVKGMSRQESVQPQNYRCYYRKALIQDLGLEVQAYECELCQVGEREK